MASQSLAIQLGVTGEQAVTGALKGVNSSIASLGKVATAPLRALGSLGGAMGDIAKNAVAFAAGGALAQAPGMLLEMAKGAAADEQATQRLQATMASLPGNFNDISKAVDGAIAAGQKLAFSDDDVRDSFQFLAQATGTSEEALKRQKVAMDLARGANIPLAQASKLVGKVNAENVDTFKKLGINIKEGASEAEALATIQAKFANQAEAYANSTAGQFEQAQIALGEIQESIGSALLPMFGALATALADNLPIIQEWVGAFAGGIAEIAGPLASKLLDTFENIGHFLSSGEIFEDAGFLYDFKDGLTAIYDAAEPLRAVLPDLGKAIDQAVGFMVTGKGDIETFRGVLNRLIGEEGAKKVIDVFTDLTGTLQNDVKPAVQAMIDTLPVLQQAFSDVAPVIGSMALALAGELTNATRGYIAIVKNELIPALQGIKGWYDSPSGSPTLDALKGWFATILPEAIGVWANIVGLMLTGPTGALVKLYDWYKGDGTTMFNGLKTFFETTITTAIQTAQSAFQGLLTFIQGAFTQAINAAVNSGPFKLMLDTIDAIKRAVNNTIDAVRRLIDLIRSIPSIPGGPSVGGGRFGTAGGAGGITINNTIDARGMSSGDLTRAVSGDLATLMRTRLVSGAA